MVRAILSGAKTQTRRVVKPQPPRTVLNPTMVARDAAAPSGYSFISDEYDDVLLRCPYGVPGNRLWVREAWRTVREADDTAPRDMDAAYRLWYEADAHADHHAHQLGYGKLRPGMFMPRWASRITLQVTGLRVERLADITEADARAEGVTPTEDPSMFGVEGRCLGLNARESYALLWESINGPGSCDANPWVWVVEFKRV